MIRFFTFKENDVRDFSPASSLFDAVRTVRDGEADGLCVDFSSDFERTSYEVMPGRALVEWHGDECF